MSLLNVNSIAKADGSQETTLDDLFSGRAKAWANLNGTGTIALRDSQNISSTTDNGTGDYSHNLTTAFGSAVQAVTHGVANGSSTNDVGCAIHSYTASSYRLLTRTSGTAALDAGTVNSAAHGDF